MASPAEHEIPSSSSEAAAKKEVSPAEAPVPSVTMSAAKQDDPSKAGVDAEPELSGNEKIADASQSQSQSQSQCQSSDVFTASRLGDSKENTSNKSPEHEKGRDSLESESESVGPENALLPESPNSPNNLSESDTPSEKDKHITQPQSTDNPSENQDQEDEMVYEKASIMDFVKPKKPKKKGKSKKKKKKGGNAGSSNDESVGASMSKHPDKIGESSTSKVVDDDDGCETEPGLASSSKVVEKCVAKKSAVSEEADVVVDDSEKMVEQQSSADIKGKKPVYFVSESDASKDDEGQSLALSQPLPVRPKQDASQVAESTKPAEAEAKNAKPSTPSPPAKKSRKKSSSKKEKKLPAICEGEVQQSVPTNESPMSTGTGTVSTGRSTTATQLTPQTQVTAPDPSPKVKAPKHKGNASTTSQPSAGPSTSTTATTTSTHAHPTPRSARQPVSGGRYSRPKPDNFFWQLDSHGFPCAKPGCERRCNLWDGATVICPRCGPYSEIRYCTLKHLLQDIKNHWASLCGELSFQHPCRESTIPRDVREAPPMIPCMHQYDTPERQRQAVHFAMNARRGDYFLFADWADTVAAGFPENNAAVRCSSRIVHTFSFAEGEEKDRFRRVLAACLFLTIEAHELIDYLFRLLRDKLRASSNLSESDLTNLTEALKFQIHQEFAVSIQPHITGERHACETDWDGRNRRNCPDEVCRGEYRRLLGALGNGGHSRLVENLEATYWILRAARTTHPDVKGAKERMQGQGFEGVAEEDQRVFSRGDGWDGVGSGEMEIEGINA